MRGIFACIFFEQNYNIWFNNTFCTSNLKKIMISNKHELHERHHKIQHYNVLKPESVIVSRFFFERSYE